MSAPCPLCGGSSFRSVYPGTIPDGADAAPYFGSFRTANGHLPIVRCERCELLQTRPRDDAATLGAAYAALAADDDAELLAASRTMADHQARTVARYVPRGERVLDVGAGAGAFLAALVATGHRPTGLEPSVDAAELIRARVPSASVIRSTLEEAPAPSAPFDAITLWDVLEHLVDPRAVVRRLRSWLAPRGHLFLQLPDSGSLVSRALGRRWPLLLREHLTYFDSSTVRRLLEDQGFEVLSVRPSLRFFPLGHLARRLGVNLREGASAAVRARVIGAPAGEMRVVARARG